MANKKVIPSFVCRNGQALIRFQGENRYCDDILSLSRYYSDSGADAILIHDLSATEEDHEKTIGIIKEIARIVDVPLIVGGHVKRLEDIKKYLYAGAAAAFLDAAQDENIDLIKEASDRFGNEKIYMYLSHIRYLNRVEEFGQLGASVMILDVEQLSLETFHPTNSQTQQFLLFCENNTDIIRSFLQLPSVDGVILNLPIEAENSCMSKKQTLKSNGIPVDIFESAIAWKEFKLNSDGMIPVIVQDYRSSEVLMLAYMNEESFEATLHSAKMTYFSRSRQKLWLKGETSGHFQYVKSLVLDCDNDTILAKVAQVGSACHTGAHSCFFQTLAAKEYKENNPLNVFEDVFRVILDRRLHPKEGSYTNYLFDKGIDKILKKLGEEATEIVIAAKNPDPEEIKYEISDFLYHMMVLMADKNITWEDITKELSNR